MILPTARKITEIKTISFPNEANSVEVQPISVSLSAQGTLNTEWLLHTKIPS